MTSQGSTSTPRILVVDDQPDIRLMCRVNLQLEGYEVIEAGDGEIGLEMVRTERPDLVLLDVMMPGLDGWQFMDAIKADDNTAKIPIVLLTARVQREDEIRGWLSGAADYLPKPFNPSTLTEVVRRTLMNQGDDDRRQRALDKLSIL
ncbi:MAG TPA: response regulator [Actinomycetota bacterium]|nr:response regulator [Actinomycetota bacterium]